MMTILDYILETQKVCLDILERRKEITEDFVTKVNGETIDEMVVLGSGTSCHAAMVAKSFIEKICPIKVTAAFPTIYLDQNSMFPSHSVVIGLTQSGNSTSTKLALEEAKRQGVRTAALTSNLNSKILAHADVMIELACGEELAVAKTKGYQASLMTLFVLGLEWALSRKWIDTKTYMETVDRLRRTVMNLTKVIDSSIEWYDRIKDELEAAPSMMVVGYENQLGTVMEGTLKLVETVRIPVSGYEVEEFMHGIYNAIKSDSVLIYLASPGKHRERLLKLKSYLDRKTSHQYVIASASEGASSLKDASLNLINDPDFCGLEYIIPFQIICSRLPLSKGINPFLSGDPEFHANMSSKVI